MKTIEWGIDYQDGCGVRKADSEDRARTWVAYWNARREDQGPALLCRREVTVSEWEASE